MSEHELRLRAFARLPFVSSHGEEVRALALGQLEIEPSGDDLTLLAVEAQPGLSRGGLRELLAAAGLHPGWAAAWRPDPPTPAVHLVEVDSFVAAADPRLAQAQQAARGEVLRLMPLGGYARPLSAG
jgi:chorismate mutase/prephenate dehydratase